MAGLRPSRWQVFAQGGCSAALAGGQGVGFFVRRVWELVYPARSPSSALLPFLSWGRKFPYQNRLQKKVALILFSLLEDLA